VAHHDMKLDNWPNIFSDIISLECCCDVFVYSLPELTPSDLCVAVKDAVYEIQSSHSPVTESHQEILSRTSLQMNCGMSLQKT
jgi:hypothetical protein